MDMNFRRWSGFQIVSNEAAKAEDLVTRDLRGPQGGTRFSSLQRAGDGIDVVPVDIKMPVLDGLRWTGLHGPRPSWLRCSAGFAANS